jgi:molybdopterin/thiamine biosynthesis adenylyltransferase/rhodanese-related sulfurtransferase
MTTTNTGTHSGLTPVELQRYARHITLPEVGLEGQLRLKAARVLLIGVGGLGSPAALYLAAAGVGTLGLVDDDKVSLSNLQRQVLHGHGAVGRSKLASARGRLADVNPSVKVELHDVRLTSGNAMSILADYDVIVDGSDNFPTRYLVNDACALLGKPDVYGSIHRFEGQVSVFHAERGPCYRCLYRDPPPPELVPSCEEGGVLGVLPGIVGSLQAAEAIKIILGAGDSLVGRLLLVDALAMRFRELALDKDRDCPVCGDTPTVTRLIDYDAFCASAAAPAAEASHAAPTPTPESNPMELSTSELQAELAQGRKLTIVDVREQWEWDLGHIPGSVHMPLSTIPERMPELSGTIVTVCHRGSRSVQAARFLKASGVDDVRSLRGGIEAYSVDVDPSIARY